MRNLNRIIKQVIRETNEEKSSRYMFFSNLEQMRRQCDMLLDLDKKVIALRKPSKGGDIQSLGLKETNNYVNMWLQKDVYNNSVKFTQNCYY